MRLIRERDILTCHVDLEIFRSFALFVRQGPFEYNW